MTSRDNIIALNARAIAADTEYPEHFDLAFAAPDTAQENVPGEIANYSEPRDTFPGMTLAELIDDQFASIVAALSPEAE